MTVTYTKDELDAVLGKVALGAAGRRGTVLLAREADILTTEICALRQACDCYDGSKGIALAKAVVARETRERNAQNNSTKG